MYKYLHLIILVFLVSITSNQLKAQNHSKDAEKLFSKKLYFHYVSTNINKSGEELLNQMADYLVNHPEIKIKIKGYSCNVPSKNEAIGISKQRVGVVRSYFVKKGVKMEQLQAQSFGSQAPALPNDSEYGRIKNRRIEFEIIN